MALKTIKGKLDSFDEPVEIPDSWTAWIKLGKIRAIVIYEDYTFREYYVKNKKDYILTIKKKDYLLYPIAILKGKHPTIFYYYNNPLPIQFKHQVSKLRSSDLYSKKVFDTLSGTTQDNLAKTMIDSQMLTVAMGSNLINKLYKETGLTVKNIIIIVVVLFVITAVILQATGTVDFLGMIQDLLGVKTK